MSDAPASEEPSATRSTAWIQAAHLIPAQAVPDAVEGSRTVHGVDGDGSTFCGTTPTALRHVDGIRWCDVPTTWRCHVCNVLLDD